MGDLKPWRSRMAGASRGRATASDGVASLWALLAVPAGKWPELEVERAGGVFAIRIALRFIGPENFLA